MNKSSWRAGRRGNVSAPVAAAIVALALLVFSAAALAHGRATRSCVPDSHAFALALAAKGVPCSEARRVERHAATHGWGPFRLDGRRWNATIYRRAHLHTDVSFRSGHLIVWIQLAKPSPKGGLALGSGSFIPSGYAGSFANDTPVALPDGGSAWIADLPPGDEVQSGLGHQAATVVGSIGTRPSNPGVTMMFIQVQDLPQLIASPDALIISPIGPVRAASLQTGSRVDTYDGPAAVVSVSAASFNGGTHLLGVEGPSGTFFADGVLVDGWQ